MAGRIRAHDWAATPLGAVAGWSERLRAGVETMLATPTIVSLLVGPERILLYNDRAAQEYGAKHPGVLGLPAELAFAEFHRVAGFYDRVFAGESVHVPAQALDSDEDGVTEVYEAWLVPIRGGDGQVMAAQMLGFAIGERLHAEAALRESEARFAQFAASASDALWIRDAATLRMEYASPAVEAIYGVPAAAMLGEVERWAVLIEPEQRADGLAHLGRARGGAPAVDEFAIRRPSDGARRWIRDTSFPLRDEAGRVQRIGGIAEDVTEAKAAAERQELLLAELQHRVRNILAVIRSIVRRSQDSADTVEDYVQHLDGRISALARVQVSLTRQAGAGVELEDVLREELLAQVAQESQFELDGPPVLLSAKAAEVLTLAVHELATNATKYGAFSQPDGCARIAWRVERREDRDWLALSWAERGVDMPGPAERRTGFGTELIEHRVPYDLYGTGSLTLRPGGVEARIEFPLEAGHSILQTDGAAR